ncbi:hypothetical protein NM208_g7663 [Fusarium decemcellulare]|uniref:Uncharacterized protein n=1 Tax=Fusarium decemcellulare TaxID=57161 RepID=A0ACC1S867_9HYPO|nr:hypothetical protein NM208_g7663 [Fusarium decemcellulare]
MGTLLQLTWETWKATSPAKDPAGVGNSLHVHLRRDDTPEKCYHDCDGAYKIAISVGKSDQLCKKGSDFSHSLQNCRDCIDATGGDPRDYIDPQFEPLLAFCEGKDVASTSCDTCIFSTVITRTLNLDQVATTLDSKLKDEDFTVTLHVTQQHTPTNIPESSFDGSDESSGPNVATIIGPVAPSVALLLILGFLGLRWYRRRQQSKARVTQVEEGEDEPKFYKAQLHSDCAVRPTFELEGSMPVVLDPTARNEGEMPANEVAAHEKPAEGDPKGETSQEENSRDVQEGRTVDNPGSSK